MEEDQFKITYKKALNLLTRRGHSRMELQCKLLQKGHETQWVNAALDKLVDNGWLNDQHFAETFSRQKIAKGYGPVKIAYELRARGIDDFDLSQVVCDVAEDWETLLENVYEKKFSSDRTITRTEWAKRNRFLLHRGFTGEQIKGLVKKLGLQFE